MSSFQLKNSKIREIEANADNHKYHINHLVFIYIFKIYKDENNKKERIE
jgi:hypothetical protein